MLIIKNALEQSERAQRIWVCRDGEEALDFLSHRGAFASKTAYPKPDIILLDLRLPEINCLELLSR